MGRDGSHFQVFWAAARLTVTGSPARAYDLSAMQAVQASLGRPEWFAFVNPPPCLLLVAPLGLLPYPLAWWVWVVAVSFGLPDGLCPALPAWWRVTLERWLQRGMPRPACCSAQCRQA